MPKGTRRGTVVYTESQRMRSGGYYVGMGARSTSTTEQHARRVIGDRGMAKAKGSTRYTQSTGMVQSYISTSNLPTSSRKDPQRRGGSTSGVRAKTTTSASREVTKRRGR